MTKDEAVRLLANNWAGCKDAFGLITALEEMGAVKFEKANREQLLDRAAYWRRSGHIIEVNPDAMARACRLICDLADELERKS